VNGHNNSMLESDETPPVDEKVFDPVSEHLTLKKHLV
jgi:hypothetical protein